MTVWQVDFYRRPLQDEAGQSLWELVVCEATGADFGGLSLCPQQEANAAWIAQQLQYMAGGKLPEKLQVFRPQALSLVTEAAQRLGIEVEATRHVPVLKQLLQRRAADYVQMPGYTGQAYDPLALEMPPPVPVPETLWGDRWRFGSIAAADLEPAFAAKPIPIFSMPKDLMPANLGLASTLAIPGVIIDGGRVSMRLAQWLGSIKPAFLSYIPGSPDGLILDAGLADRWVLATFEDPDVQAAAKSFQERQTKAQGLHFLLVQPDDSGVTYSGLWLLQKV
ncbi:MULTISPECIES: Tab2/Atab2 family RNA-binding protein [unclassified Leptolyngbya]|uniref:Tab2/Atab2 family RNA-binding protein n=1 Tax=unclassified Leptolyngbya TaxID=2650499 RepID=UPI00168404BC|nr:MULTISPECIES: Tab2/Atab2 family RNA-binding protein [unclassified Leptolyngbya]MBD1909625.1 Tab2/Atab2 family RNA-binding protein [Leptolyngbya sp. FACHB-8]MBD2154163.1 Tab2/Atab2 family RNA-binding protein [Leptolyngbya sp. FACHB-16]